MGFLWVVCGVKAGKGAAYNKSKGGEIFLMLIPRWCQPFDIATLAVPE